MNELATHMSFLKVARQGSRQGVLIISIVEGRNPKHIPVFSLPSQMPGDEVGILTFSFCYWVYTGEE